MPRIRPSVLPKRPDEQDPDRKQGRRPTAARRRRAAGSAFPLTIALRRASDARGADIAIRDGCTRTYVRVEQEGELRRAARPQRLLVPRRGLAAGGAGGAGGGARLHGARAHRPRRRLRLARVRARGEAPRRPADHRRRGDARRRLARHAARRDAAGLREPLPAAHRRARADAAEGGAGAAAAVARPVAARGAARGARLPLRLRAARARRPRPERGRAARRVFGRDRFFVELQRPYERGDARRNAALRELAETLRVPTVATGDVHAHDARRAVLQDVLVAIRCRTSLDGCERERRGNHECVLAAPAGHARALPGRPRRRRAHRRARRAARRST